MPIIPLKCPNCGGSLSINSEKDADICEYCKEAFVVKDAIVNNYISYVVNNNISISTESVDINVDFPSKENLLIRAKQYYKEGKYNQALDYCNKYLDLDPTNQEVLSFSNEIDSIVNHVYIPGELVKGKIVRLLPYGVMFEIIPGKTGFIHISKLRPWRIGKVEDVVSVGDEIWGEYTGEETRGMLSFSANSVAATEKNGWKR